MPYHLKFPEPALQLINESTSFNNSSIDDILRAEFDIPKSDMEYVCQYKQSVNTMEWKKCYETGKNEGFLTTILVLQV
jgi:hypothetical protein